MAVSFCTSFISAAFGLGGGSILLAVLATFLPPAALVPVHGVVQFGSNSGRALVFRRALARPVVIPFVLGSLVGIIPGGLLVVELPPAAIRIGIGLFLLWTVILKPPGFLRRSPPVTGAISSFLTMFFGATGPFIAACIRAQTPDRMAYVATFSACMTMQHLLKICVFGLLGFAFGPYLVLIAGMIACGFCGTLVGRRVLMRIDERRFALILKAILVVLALQLIHEGAQEIMENGI